MNERILTMTTQSTNQWKYRKQYREYGESADTGYPALIVAIVKLAVDDYIEAQRKLDNPPAFARKGDEVGYKMKWRDEQRKIVSFFKSQWYATLCDIDPDLILRKLGVKA